MLYHVTVDANFEIKAKDSISIKRKLLRLLKENGFEQKDFAIGIERANNKKTPEPIVQKPVGHTTVPKKKAKASQKPARVKKKVKGKGGCR
jgi:hypothetical protein